MRRLLKSVFRALPAPVQAAYLRVRETSCGLWILTGSERSTGAPLTVAYAGEEPLKNYMVKRLFKEGVSERSAGRVKRDAARRAAGALAPDLDLFFCEIPRSQEKTFRPRAFAVLPAWVRFDAALGPDAPSQKGKKIRNIRNIVAREALTREVTRDPAQFERFYRDFYSPYVGARHEGASVAMPLELARRKFVAEGLELFWVKKDGVELGGGVIRCADGEADFWLMGVGPAVPDAIVRDLGDAVYFHMFALALEKGCDHVNLGHCRPFLTDGIARYKMGFGARPVARHMEEEGALALEVVRSTAAVKGWLKEDPLVAVEAGGDYAVHAFVDEGAEAEVAAAVANWRERYAAPGGLGLRVHALSPELRLAREERP